MKSPQEKEEKKIKAWAIIMPLRKQTIHSFTFEPVGGCFLSEDHSAIPVFEDEYLDREYIRDRKKNGLDRKFKVVKIEIVI